MDNFIVSARKYRPQSFDSVVGQHAITDTLKRAIVSHKLAGAYLFCGPRGVGKTTCARIFAKAINCLNPHEDGEACDECESCKSFNEGRSVNVQELNAAANNSVEDIRNIIDQVRIPPQLGHYKVVILDEVHMLSAAASNALLKTLEEPPSYVIFILATTEKQKILPTILSRCQIFDFNRMGVSDIVEQLKMIAQREQIQYEEAALNVIAQKDDGGMRDSLSIFDQVTSFSNGNITMDSVQRCLNVLDYEYYFKMTDALLTHNVSQALLIYNDVVTKGFNGGVFISGLASHLRDLLVSRQPETLSLLDVADSLRSHYTEQAARCKPQFLYQAIPLCDRCGNAYKTAYNKRLSVEICLIQISQLDVSDTPDAAGLGPTQTIKPLFKNTQPRAASCVPQAARPATPTSAPVSSDSGQGAGTPIQTVPSSQSPVSAASPTVPTTASKTSASSTPTAKPATGNASSILRHIGSVSIKLHSTGQTPVSPSANENGASYQPSQAHTDASASQAESEVREEAAFDAAQLAVSWRRFANSLPQSERASQGRMLGMTLDLEQGNRVIVNVNNEDVVKSMSAIFAQAQDFLRHDLHNSSLTLTPKIVISEEKQVIYDPRKLYTQLVQKNKAFAQVAKHFQLKID